MQERRDVSEMLKLAIASFEEAYASAHELNEIATYLWKSDQVEGQGEAFANDLASLSDYAQDVAGELRELTSAIELLLNQHQMVEPMKSDEIAGAVNRALAGREIFLYSDGDIVQNTTLVATLNALVEGVADESTFFHGSLIGFLFGRDPEKRARLVARIRDALVGKASAERTREEVQAYTDFLEAVKDVPRAAIVTEQFVFLKTSDGVFAFDLNEVRREALLLKPDLATDPEALYRLIQDGDEGTGTSALPPGDG